MQNLAQPCELNRTGAPVELRGEVTFRIQPSVDLYDGGRKSEQHRKGVAYITSHRVIWRAETTAVAIQWLLSQVRESVRESSWFLDFRRVQSLHNSLTPSLVRSIHCRVWRLRAPFCAGDPY